MLFIFLTFVYISGISSTSTWARWQSYSSRADKQSFLRRPQGYSWSPVSRYHPRGYNSSPAIPPSRIQHKSPVSGSISILLYVLQQSKQLADNKTFPVFSEASFGKFSSRTCDKMSYSIWTHYSAFHYVGLSFLPGFAESWDGWTKITNVLEVPSNKIISVCRSS